MNNAVEQSELLTWLERQDAKIPNRWKTAFRVRGYIVTLVGALIWLLNLQDSWRKNHPFITAAAPWVEGAALAALAFIIFVWQIGLNRKLRQIIADNLAIHANHQELEDAILDDVVIKHYQRHVTDLDACIRTFDSAVSQFNSGAGAIVRASRDTPPFIDKQLQDAFYAARGAANTALYMVHDQFKLYFKREWQVAGVPIGTPPALPELDKVGLRGIYEDNWSLYARETQDMQVNVAALNATLAAAIDRMSNRAASHTDARL